MDISEENIEDIYYFTIKKILDIYENEKINDKIIKDYFKNKLKEKFILTKNIKEILNKIELIKNDVLTNKHEERIKIIQKLFNNYTKNWIKKLIKTYPNILTQSTERIKIRIKYYIYCCENKNCKIAYNPKDPYITGISLKQFLSSKEQIFLKKMRTTQKEFLKWKSELK